MSRPLAPIQHLGRPSAVGGPNGLFVGGPNGLIYQTSVSAGHISVVDPFTGDVLDRIGRERGVFGPDDVFVTDEGLLYWTDFFVGRVGRLSTDGRWRVQHGIAGPNPITMHEGRLFTASTLFGTGLWELDPELVDEPRRLLDDLANPNAFAFGPDGLLYCPIMFEGRVVTIDIDDSAAVVGRTVADGFRMPSSVKVDVLGRLIVTDYAGGQVVRVDVRTGDRDVLLDIDGVLDNSALGPDGVIYSAAQADGTIWAIDPSGSTRQVTDGGFVGPGGIAIDARGRLVVADWFSLHRYEGETVESIWYNRVDSGMLHVNTVAVAGDVLVVTGMMRGTLQVLDPATGDVRLDVRDLAVPTNAADHGGEIVVAQAGSRDGRGPGDVVCLSDRRVLLDGLELPTGLASDGTTLYSADWSTGMVWAVEPSGTRVVAAGLSHPEGLALTGEGTLLVVEEGIDQVTEIDLTTRDRRAVASVPLGRTFTPGLLLPYGVMAGVAVASDGTFWVASDVEGRLLRFSLGR
jgi:sugar lactone lactonase YvrE